MVVSLICTCIWRGTEAQEVEGNSTGWREILRNGSSQEKEKVTETSSHQYSRIGGLWLQSFHHRQSKMKPWSLWPKMGVVILLVASAASSPFISRVSNQNTHKPALQMICRRTVGKLYFRNLVIKFSFDRLKLKDSNHTTTWPPKKKQKLTDSLAP